MPTYEYKCPSCGLTTEEFLSIKDADKEIPCPKCDTTMEKQISGSNFVVKGYNAKNLYGSSDTSRRK